MAGQHARRFDAVGAQKGTGLHVVVGQLKALADTVEDWYDPNSAEVVGAMQRFEQGLALLSTAPAHPESGEPGGEKPSTSGEANTEQTPKASSRRKKTDDTPKTTAEGQGATDA